MLVTISHSPSIKESNLSNLEGFIFAEGILLILGDLIKNQEDARKFRFEGTEIDVLELFIYKPTKYVITILKINDQIEEKLRQAPSFLPLGYSIALEKSAILSKVDLAEIRENFNKLEDRFKLELLLIKKMMGLPSEFSGSAHEIFRGSERHWISKAYDTEKLLYDEILKKSEKALDILEETTVLYNNVLEIKELKENPVLLQKRSFLEKLAEAFCFAMIRKTEFILSDFSFSIIPEISRSQKPLIARVRAIDNKIEHPSSELRFLIRDWHYFPSLKEELLKIVLPLNKGSTDGPAFASFLEKKLGEKKWDYGRILIVYDTSSVSWIGEKLLKDLEKINGTGKEGIVVFHRHLRDDLSLTPKDPKEIFLISSEGKYDELKRYINKQYLTLDSKKITCLKIFKKGFESADNPLDLSSLADGRNYAYFLWLFGLLFSSSNNHWFDLPNLLLEVKNGLDNIYSGFQDFESTVCLKNIDVYEHLLPYVKTNLDRQIVHLKVAQLYLENLEDSFITRAYGWKKAEEHLNFIDLKNSEAEITYVHHLCKLKIECQKALFSKDKEEIEESVKKGLSFIKRMDNLEFQHKINKDFSAKKEFYQYSLLHFIDKKEAFTHLENYFDLCPHSAKFRHIRDAKNGKLIFLRDIEKNAGIWTKLMLAALENKKTKIEECIAEGKDVNYVTSNGCTALMVAAERGYWQIVQKLIEVGAKLSPVECVYNNYAEALQQLQNRLAAINNMNTKNKEHRIFFQRLINAIFLHSLVKSKYMHSTPLVLASENNHLETVQILIAAKANIDLIDSFGWTALTAAIKNNHIRIVEILIKEGANVNLVGADGKTPLVIAVEKNNKAIVETLVEKGADVNLVGADGKTPLVIAAENNNMMIVEILIKMGADVNLASVDGQIALITAVEKSNLSVVKALIKAGAAVDIADANGQTALMAAVKKDNLLIIEYLIGEGANVNYKISEGIRSGMTVLMVAAEHGYEATVKALLQKGSEVNYVVSEGPLVGWTALMVAAQHGHKDVIKELLDKEANINQKRPNGWTALMFAIANNRPEVFDILIERGAYTDLSMVGGWTPLMLASQHGCTEAAKRLIKLDAKVDQTLEDGQTALMLAAWNEHKELVQLLLAERADVNKNKIDGNTALTIAAQKGSREIVEILLQLGAKADHSLKDGQTALTIAAENGYKEITALLVSKGAEVNHIRVDELTPLMLAAKNRFTDVARVLIEAGAKVNYSLKDGRTALMLAAMNGDREFVNILLNAGADVNKTSAKGESSLLIAAQNSYNDLVEVFINKGADVDKIIADNLTVQRLVMNSGNRKIIQFLMKTGIEKENLELVNSFIKAGADVNYKASNGDTFLMMAAEKGNLDLVKILIQAGADVTSKNFNGDKASGLASKKGHLKIAQLLLDLESNTEKLKNSDSKELEQIRTRVPLLSRTDTKEKYAVLRFPNHSREEESKNCAIS